VCNKPTRKNGKSERLFADLLRDLLIEEMAQEQCKKKAKKSQQLALLERK
jgi:hypothetical protein